MDKKLQMLLGVAAVGFGAYWLWKQQQSKEKVFANLKGGGGIVTSNCVAGTLGVGTYYPTASPMRCHWSCEDKNTGELVNLGPAPCTATI